MLTVLMYSYKGGAGRTVATANIAAILAKEFEKNVVCVDLDIESAGLAVVFDVHKKVEGEGRRCLQDVLKRKAFRSDREFEEWWPTLHLDVGLAEGLPAERLVVIPSRAAHYDSVEWAELSGEGGEIGEPLENLLQKLRVRRKWDFVLLDSASGLSDPATVGLGCANCVVTFLRWNRQFLEGTIEAANFILGNLTMSPQLKNIKNLFLVPTAVPIIDAGEAEFRRRLETNTRRLRIALRVGEDPRVEILPTIPESKWLKWEERILAFEQVEWEGYAETLDAYRAIARRLIEAGDSRRRATR